MYGLAHPNLLARLAQEVAGCSYTHLQLLRKLLLIAEEMSLANLLGQQQQKGQLLPPPLASGPAEGYRNFPMCILQACSLPLTLQCRISCCSAKSNPSYC